MQDRTSWLPREPRGGDGGRVAACIPSRSADLLPGSCQKAARTALSAVLHPVLPRRHAVRLMKISVK